MNYEDTTKDNLQLGTKCCNAGRKWHSGVPNNGSYWVCAKCNKPLGDVSPTEPVEKCECGEEISTVVMNHPSGVKIGDKMCPKCGRVYITEPVIEDWEKEFDEKFGIGYFSLRTLLEIRKHFKAFIRQTRLSLLEDLERELESKKEIPAVIPHHSPYLSGLNAGLQVGVDVVRSKMK